MAINEMLAMIRPRYAVYWERDSNLGPHFECDSAEMAQTYVQKIRKVRPKVQAYLEDRHAFTCENI